MTKKPTSPSTSPKPLPLPQGGGSYIRNPDGSLTRVLPVEQPLKDD